MGVSSATLAPFWANDFSTANWADETWFWPARNKDHSIRPAVQRKNCRVGKETGPGELGMVCTGIVCAQTLGWFPGSLKWSINWNQLWENFGCSFSLDVHNLMLSALFAGCCAPRLLGRAAAFPFDTLKAGVAGCCQIQSTTPLCPGGCVQVRLATNSVRPLAMSRPTFPGRWPFVYPSLIHH